MATNLTTTHQQYCQQAVAILGLPTNAPITHQAIQRAYSVVIRNVHETAACEAMLLVQLLAYDYVDTNGWEVVAPPTFTDTATLEPIDMSLSETDGDAPLQP